MKKWILLALFLVVGIGVLVAGIYYMKKEKNDKHSVKIYRNTSIVGAVITVFTIIYAIVG